MKLIRLREQDLKEAGIPFTKGTLRVWHSKGKNKEIFKKVSGRLFIDLDAFENWVEKQNKKEG